MKRILSSLGSLVALSLLFSGTALANVPSLQVAPLSYQGKLKSGVVETGYIDVANPSDESIEVTSNIQAFRQVDARGDLAFYTNPAYTAAITVGLGNFSLGPREAVRVVFNIDPSKLPQGGVYAAIFFRTVPTAQNSNNSYVLQSANVGTLLILTNGNSSPDQGEITGLSAKFLQFGGSGLTGDLGYKNTEGELNSAGFTPSLTTTALPWGHATKMQSGLILPGVTRNFKFSRPGSFFGLIPITVTDSATGVHKTTWVLADTGNYVPGIPVVILGLILLYILAAPRLQILLEKSKPDNGTPTGEEQTPAANLAGSKPPEAESLPSAEASPETLVEAPVEIADPLNPQESPDLQAVEAEELEKEAELDLSEPAPGKKVKVAVTKITKPDRKREHPKAKKAARGKKSSPKSPRKKTS